MFKKRRHFASPKRMVSGVKLMYKRQELRDMSKYESLDMMAKKTVCGSMVIGHVLREENVLVKALKFNVKGRRRRDDQTVHGNIK